MKKIKLKREDILSNSTVAVETGSEPITIEDLEDIYTQREIIPMKFKPTGEIVYVTAQIRDCIEKTKKENPEYFK